MGIGLVKLMGRQSGHIAASAALAQGDANFVLIPEEPFDMEGDKGSCAISRDGSLPGSTPSSSWPKAPGRTCSTEKDR